MFCIEFLYYLVCLFQMVFAVFLGHFLASCCDVIVLDRSNCRAFEKNKQTLSLSGQDSFLVTLDLGFGFPGRLLSGYSDGEDDQGRQCLSEMTVRLNSSYESFRRKINDFRREKQMLEMYFSSVEFLGREKRMSGGVIFAILISVANIFASSTNIFMSLSSLKAFENRLSVMSQHIEHMESNQFVLENNINLLFEKDEFMGVRQNLLVDYLNSLSASHACNAERLFI